MYSAKGNVRRIGEKMPMKKYYCDRCGAEIEGESLRMIPSFTKDLSMYMKTKISSLMEPLQKMDFCEECLAEIVDFALNKSPCDECVQQMMEENAILREEAEETGSSTKIEPDPDEIDWNAALNRMEQCRFSAKVLIPAEKIQEIERIIREECRYESGQYVIPMQPIDPELIQKYKRASQLSAGSGNEVEKTPE